MDGCGASGAVSSLRSFVPVSRKVEKLEVVPSPVRPPGQMTLGEILDRPFGLVTIQRPLLHFDRALALTPGVAGEPGLEVLTRLLTGYRSHQAMLRQHLGDRLYRNFENVVREKNEPTTETLTELSRIFDSSPANIMGMAHGQKQGPLLPQYLQILQIPEVILSWTYENFTATPIPCPCCGKNILDDTQEYWRGQTSVRLDQPEYQFVERCLTALVIWRRFKVIISMHGLPVGQRFSSTNPDPADPRQYPVGNWLQAVRNAYGCSDNLALEKRLACLPPSSRPSSPISQLRLNKWACGEDLIPLDVGESIVQGLPTVDNFRHGLLEARSIVFLQEFVRAAALGTDAPPPVEVRIIVHKRVEGLANKLRYSFHKAAQEMRPTAEPGRTTAA